ncbi:hypothetical protein FA13DRAFT_1778868 [Coprinellus micaceus]|uniref:Fungal-type protein kinase domain-containing protein n=1 Tax=Coprinellus micaceus TaxID=71717 RepID=A0A4Y7SK38_COPMI|nr:hypothetical protein FA13DRAFT_1778868 [Coprinellus micaceus]
MPEALSKKRWAIPDSPTKRGSLVDALYLALLSVVARFVKPREPRVERHIFNIQGYLECKQKDENGHAARPVLVVPAMGPSFDLPQVLHSVPSSELAEVNLGYSCMANLFHRKHWIRRRGVPKEQVDEMETYARKILRDQPNRLYVRSLVLTESKARLFHFDRAGAEITPPFDIHQHPGTLVRLVAGLCSANKRVLGLDTSVQWTIVDQKKSEGTITDHRTPDTLEELVVKDSWRIDGLRAEDELLKLVKDTPGVVHMVSYEIGRGETKDFRCPSTIGSFQNRVATRVTTKAYGCSVEHFKSVVQLLSAIRDAIASRPSPHAFQPTKGLVADDIGILHRDVSDQNVLLGKDDAPEGERGVLTDFDLAFRATISEPTIKADHNVGLPIFQSLSVLSTVFGGNKNIPHVYLDDLQAPDGSRVPSAEEGPSILFTWNDGTPRDTFVNKQGLTAGNPIMHSVGRLIKASWGRICEDLFKKFRAWTVSRRSDTERLLFQKKGPEDLLPKRDEHCSAVLKMFDKDIQATKSSAKTSMRRSKYVAQPASAISSWEKRRPQIRITPIALLL